MMNGAAMNYLQGQVPGSQSRDSRGTSYRLQMNCHSKAQSDNSLTDDGSYQYFQQMPLAGDPRSQDRWIKTRQPLDLPVPQFEEDGNCVASCSPHSDLNNPNLDLDTRIDLLIKSKALAGMHPIFSELAESEGDDSKDSFTTANRIKRSVRRRPTISPPLQRFAYEDEFDDPEKPLSRPPSPFLSRATYLFWFNKAIELKEQAKAQERALLEEAAKKLQNTSTIVTNVNMSDNEKNTKMSDNGKDTFLNCLMSEISKEIKETIKQQFINEVIENVISNTFESLCGRDSINHVISEVNKNTLECRPNTTGLSKLANVVPESKNLNPKGRIHNKNDELISSCKEINVNNKTKDKLPQNLNVHSIKSEITLADSDRPKCDRRIKESLSQNSENKFDQSHNRFVDISVGGKTTAIDSTLGHCSDRVNERKCDDNINESEIGQSGSSLTDDNKEYSKYCHPLFHEKQKSESNKTVLATQSNSEAGDFSLSLNDTSEATTLSSEEKNSHV